LVQEILKAQIVPNDLELFVVIVKDPICGVPIVSDETEFKADVRGRTYYFCSDNCRHIFLERSYIAYFSMEIGIRSEIPTYSGGLGVLAGDTIRSSADLRIPLVAVTLVARKGYLKQKLTEDGRQIEYPDEWDPSKFMDHMPVEVEVKISSRKIKVHSWLFEYQSLTGGLVPILFLDTDIQGNAPEDRQITDFLYGGDESYRLKQEIILGIGGIRVLKALDFDLRKYHMNEGHSSLLTLELMKRNGMDPDKVRNVCIFTTHTPVEAAFDKFSYDLVQELLNDEFPLDVIKKEGGTDKLNMTLLALNLSKYINGVTNAHMEFSKKLFPGHTIWAITNGVHSYTWTCEAFRELYNKYIPNWANEPELLVRVDEVPNNELWSAHMNAKKDLLEYVNKKTNVSMDPSTLTIGFARRATAYKRATLIFSEIDQLREINKRGQIQLILSGKAHPRDVSGKEMIREIFRYKTLLKDEIKIAYLENYDIDIAAKLTSGVDVWLNTPLPPLEASGTSGMKAAHNGVINFSVLDGWWLEGCIEGITGWSIGPSPEEQLKEDDRRVRELQDLYDKLRYLVVPMYYKNRDAWVDMMENSVGKVAYYFNSHRMMRRYVTEAYML
jgi:starch phosphorylase